MKKFLFMFCFLLATNNLFCDDNSFNKQIDTSYTAQKKSTTGAILRSLALPGWGQIYVEHYWRAPIFFAGATTLWYFVIDNHLKANDLKKQIDIIENINKTGTTILLVEQNAKMALSIAHRAYVIETGSIVMSGTGEELAKSDEIKKSYLGGE